MKVAVIPARGGSKRIPRKNIKIFNGRPMIAWSIETALISGCFDHVIVSTDDAEIARVATSCGAEVPFMRPADIADDYATTTAVIKHAVEWCTHNLIGPDLVCCIYATAPFLRPEDIIRGLTLMQKNECEYAFTMVNYPAPIQRALRVRPDGCIEMLYPENYDIRSQDLEPMYHDAGQLYWGTHEAWVTQRPIFMSRSVPIFLPQYRVQDIDTPDDWIRAEQMFNAMCHGNNR